MPLTWAGEIGVLWPLSSVRVSSPVEEKQLNECSIFQQTRHISFQTSVLRVASAGPAPFCRGVLRKNVGCVCQVVTEVWVITGNYEGLRSPSQNRYNPVASYLTQYASLIHLLSNMPLVKIHLVSSQRTVSELILPQKW